MPAPHMQRAAAHNALRTAGKAWRVLEHLRRKQRNALVRQEKRVAQARMRSTKHLHLALMVRLVARAPAVRLFLVRLRHSAVLRGCVVDTCADSTRESIRRHTGVRALAFFDGSQH